jgi:hypothetical protein
MVGGAYAAVSASKWVVESPDGRLLDGASLGGATRYFGLGHVVSTAGGTAYFAIATSAGTILYFDSTTLAQVGQIKSTASKLVLSSDGSLLAAQEPGTVAVYDLPTGNLLYTWSSPALDIELSGSGAVLGQDLDSGVQEASAPTGGTPIFSDTFAYPSTAPPLRISPDGTLIAVSHDPTATPASSTDLLQNGTFIATFTGVPAGWLDNTRLVVNNYKLQPGTSVSVYSGCTIYDTTAHPTNDACGLPAFVSQFQAVANDAVYVPLYNQIFSVSTGVPNWSSGDATGMGGAVAGSRIIFVSGSNLLAQPY